MQPTSEYMLSIARRFALAQPPVSAQPYGNGHINDTFLVLTQNGPRYILQRMNRSVFHRPDQVMENIARVTAHLREKIIQAGGDPNRETLTLVPTPEGGTYYVDEQGDYFRVYLFVEHTVSYDRPDSPALFERAAESFGHFQRLLADFPAETLNETIANFHNTPERYRQLCQAQTLNAAGRLSQVERELDWVHARKDKLGALVNAGLPLRVTHNDTKLNNILMDETTGRGICIIDLDTVMSALAAYDFGDSIRFGANTAAEDENDLDRVRLDIEMFDAYARGYLRAAGAALETAEIELLPMGAYLMTLECGMRFLADYLNGDVYFRIHREGHNLDRARNQLRLAQDMERRMGEMERVIRAYKSK